MARNVRDILLPFRLTSVRDVKSRDWACSATAGRQQHGQQHSQQQAFSSQHDLPPQEDCHAERGYFGVVPLQSAD